MGIIQPINHKEYDSNNIWCDPSRRLSQYCNTPSLNHSTSHITPEHAPYLSRGTICAYNIYNITHGLASKIKVDMAVKMFNVSKFISLVKSIPNVKSYCCNEKIHFSYLIIVQYWQTDVMRHDCDCSTSTRTVSHRYDVAMRWSVGITGVQTLDHQKDLKSPSVRLSVNTYFKRPSNAKILEFSNLLSNEGRTGVTRKRSSWYVVCQQSIVLSGWHNYVVSLLQNCLLYQENWTKVLKVVPERELVTYIITPSYVFRTRYFFRPILYSLTQLFRCLLPTGESKDCPCSENRTPLFCRLRETGSLLLRQRSW